MNKFTVDDCVRIERTNSPLDGTFGTVLGTSVNGIVTVYIVALDKRLRDYPDRAVTIPGGCLERADAIVLGSNEQLIEDAKAFREFIRLNPTSWPAKVKDRDLKIARLREVIAEGLHTLIEDGGFTDARAKEIAKDGFDDDRQPYAWIKNARVALEEIK